MAKLDDDDYYGGSMCYHLTESHVITNQFEIIAYKYADARDKTPGWLFSKLEPLGELEEAVEGMPGQEVKENILDLFRPDSTGYSVNFA
jgi:hypothetical protein